MRCDLHVHSRRSGCCNLPVLRSLIDECYSEPEEIYARARARGMDLVTITDHDRIDGALEIAHLPGTFVSEELTVALPGGRQLHLGVFDVREEQHERMQGLRGDAEALFAYLSGQRLPACLNHPFAALTGKRETADYELPLRRLRLVEAINGAMPEDQNELARRAGRAAGLAGVGGSDAHALAFVARSFTTVAGGRCKEDFIAGLRRGLTVPGGRSGSSSRLASEMARVFTAACIDRALSARKGGAVVRRFLGSLVLVPLFPIIPLAALVLHRRERRFAREHFRSLEAIAGWSFESPSPISHRRSRPRRWASSSRKSTGSRLVVTSM